MLPLFGGFEREGGINKLEKSIARAENFLKNPPTDLAQKLAEKRGCLSELEENFINSEGDISRARFDLMIDVIKKVKYSDPLSEQERREKKIDEMVMVLRKDEEIINTITAISSPPLMSKRTPPRENEYLVDIERKRRMRKEQ